MPIITVPRTLGSTVTVNTTPLPSFAAVATVQARGRDGVVIAQARDGVVVARGRDGQLVGRPH